MRIFRNLNYSFRQYGGGGTREFKIFSKIKSSDGWDFCLNGSLSEILSKSDEVTRYFPLEHQRSVRFVKLRTVSVYKGPDEASRGGLQYFSENTLGTPGASYQGKSGLAGHKPPETNSFPISVCPLDLEIFQKFDFSSLGQMYIDRGSGISITNLADLLVNIPHQNESVVLECPPGRARCSLIEELSNVSSSLQVTPSPPIPRGWT